MVMNEVLILDHVFVASLVEQGKPSGPRPTIGEVLGKEAAAPMPYRTSSLCPQGHPFR